jgi:NAD(P)-dependent dehydrogenase (short-subunit alcohol dehydrogenase family)
MAKFQGLEGKTAWITGGGKGIGRAVAQELAAQGARVLITGRDERALGETIGEITNGGGKARHLVADVRSEAAAQACVDNAGVSGHVGIDQDLARAREILEVNVLGTYTTFAVASRVMKGPGRLLAVSSVLGVFGVPGYAAYCASKAGLLGMVRALALELAPKQITCNALVPGWVDTDMADQGLAEIARATGRSVDEVRAAEARDVPIGRFLAPTEVADLAAFVLSSAGAGITGQALHICGGATA